jgi:hypothetical protein
VFFGNLVQLFALLAPFFYGIAMPLSIWSVPSRASRLHTIAAMLIVAPQSGTGLRYGRMRIGWLLEGQGSLSSHKPCQNIRRVSPDEDCWVLQRNQ